MGAKGDHCGLKGLDLKGARACENRTRAPNELTASNGMTVRLFQTRCMRHREYGRLYYPGTSPLSLSSEREGITPEADIPTRPILWATEARHNSLLYSMHV